MASDPLPQPGSPLDPSLETNAESVSPSPLSSTPPGSSNPNPLSPATSQGSDLGLTPNVAAGLAVLVSPFSGIVFLILEKRNQFVRFWAMQSVFFGVAAIVFSIASAVIYGILHFLWPLAVLWYLLSLVIRLGFLVVWIIMLIQAFSGKEWEIPTLGPLVRQQLGKPPTV